MPIPRDLPFSFREIWLFNPGDFEYFFKEKVKNHFMRYAFLRSLLSKNPKIIGKTRLF